MQHNIFNIIFGVMYINSHDLRNYVSLNIRIECSRWFFKIILSIRRKKKKKGYFILFMMLMKQYLKSANYIFSKEGRNTIFEVILLSPLVLLAGKERLIILNFIPHIARKSELPDSSVRIFYTFKF